MKTLALGVLAAAVIAILAGLAIWPAVADAPWEQETHVDEVEETTDVRCEGALDFRNTVIEAGKYRSGSFNFNTGATANNGNPGGLRDYEAQLQKAEREIARYC